MAQELGEAMAAMVAALAELEAHRLRPVPPEEHDSLCEGRTAVWHSPRHGVAGCVRCGAVVATSE